MAFLPELEEVVPRGPQHDDPPCDLDQVSEVAARHILEYVVGSWEVHAGVVSPTQDVSDGPKKLQGIAELVVRAPLDHNLGKERSGRHR